jgi:hypothetical protein
MPPTKPRKKQPISPDEILDVRPDQKLCRRCGNMVPRELQRCSFCRNAPWTWHPNSRLLILTILIGIVLFILFPLLTNREQPYHVPVTEDRKP